MYYVVRYLPHVPLNARKHRYTVGRFETAGDADRHRAAQPVSELLGIESRGD